MKNVFFLLVFMIVSLKGTAQDVKSDKTNKAAIQQLAFLVGEWHGSGWMMNDQRQKDTFRQVEKIQFKLDSTALLVQGQGRDDLHIIHNALAVITYDKDDKDYDFNSYLSSGVKGKFRAELKDKKLYWYPDDKMRYIISINDKGQWYETGEIKVNDQWYQFFEMTLEKKG